MQRIFKNWTYVLNDKDHAYFNFNEKKDIAHSELFALALFVIGVFCIEFMVPHFFESSLVMAFLRLLYLGAAASCLYVLTKRMKVNALIRHLATNGKQCVGTLKFAKLILLLSGETGPFVYFSKYEYADEENKQHSVYTLIDFPVSCSEKTLITPPNEVAIIHDPHDHSKKLALLGAIENYNWLK